MSAKWIAVVTRTEARVFSAEDFRLIAKLTNQLGREKNRAMTNARPGLGHGKFARGSGFYSLTGEKNPHEDAAIAFAKRVSEYLRKQMTLHRFDKLILAAEPKMMGRVKAEMNKDLAAHTEWKAKDFGKLKPHELRKVIGP
jgi:protein required for attachment to host cells